MPPNDPSYTYGSTNEGAADPADDYQLVTLAASDLPGGICKAILCDGDGALNLTSASGQVRVSIPVVKGYNPMRAKAINSPTAGAAPAKVIALY